MAPTPSGFFSFFFFLLNSAAPSMRILSLCSWISYSHDLFMGCITTRSLFLSNRNDLFSCFVVLYFLFLQQILIWSTLSDFNWNFSSGGNSGAPLLWMAGIELPTMSLWGTPVCEKLAHLNVSYAYTTFLILHSCSQYIKMYLIIQSVLSWYKLHVFWGFYIYLTFGSCRSPWTLYMIPK